MTSLASVRRRALAANLALSLVATVLSLGGMEALLRWLEEPRRPLDAADRTMDWEKDWGGDFYVMRSSSPGWPPSDDFTRDGVRDVADAPEKPVGMRRVLCLGDSVTFGYGVRRYQSYPAVLQSRLEARGPGVEVLNVSLMAWSTRQERIAYQSIGLLGPGAAAAVGDLVAGLSDPSGRVRREAAKALGRIGPPAEAALLALESARRDANPAVRDAAAGAEAQIAHSTSRKAP